ncbi:MAG: FtsW/RodA/SpoVE family cell cycle protein [Thermotogae bacterium]|jgi:cell division protein FtsW|nr:FtsW/RodA/SpoVE family cell cycle protein [Thermotogota bacterium]MCL5032517.1 FtsW/RodA/SpoVE family cell cycle protein [Thermotogota bacterium]
METSTRRILILLSIIAAIGLVTLYSASYIMTYRYPYPPPNYYLVHQVVSMIVGVILMIILSVFDYRKHESYTGIYYILVIVALIAVFFSSGIVGSHRWISIGSYSVQSSEFAKIFILIYLASYVSRKNGDISTFKTGIFDPLVRLLPIYLLVFLEPDLGTTILLLILTLIVLYIAGAKLLHVLSIVGLGLLAFFGAYAAGLLHSYQAERLTSFFTYLVTGSSNYQANIAMSAINSGGVFGSGPGGAVYKFFLPVQFSDFIFAVFGEEFGLIGIILILLLYYMLIREIVHIALKVDDIFAKVYVTGFAFLIGVQILFNAGVSLGILPVTGVTLPFFSYGGSSVIALLAGLGVVINIAYTNRD